MAKPLTGRQLADLVRLTEDRRNPFRSCHEPGRAHHKDAMLRHGVLIAEAVTPVLEGRVQSVCNALGVPRDQVAAFVYNSPEVQADCFIESSGSCVLRFTSGLVNLLAEDEFNFVLGHELGHFLLNHESCSQPAEIGAAESFMVARSRELSADRIGYLAVGSIEASTRAIIKTASGLGSEFIRFDVSSFISQAERIVNRALGEGRNSTHPSFLIRSRALLWFSMKVGSHRDASSDRSDDIAEVNQRVLRDLEKFVDGQMRSQKAAIIDDITLWKSALLVYHEGSFGTGMQERLAREFGEETLQSLISFFELYPRSDLRGQIERRLGDAQLQAEIEFPSSVKEIENIAFEKAYAILRP